MKKIIIALPLLAVGLPLTAQEASPEPSASTAIAVEEGSARITSALADGTPSEPAPKPERPEFRIFWETKIRQGGRNVTMQEVEAPIFPKPVEAEAAPAREFTPEEIEAFLSQTENGIPQHFVTVSATIYDRRATHLKVWSHDGERREPVEAWSNADWNFLGGFASFEGRGQSFTFLMFPGNSSIENLREAHARNPEVIVPVIPDELPLYQERGARYVVMNHEEVKDEDALEFLEAIHDLYEAEKPALVEAHLKREEYRKKRAEELRLNPPKPEDIEISFWNNDVNQQPASK